MASSKLVLMSMVAAALCIQGCTTEAWQNWDWFGMKKSEGKPVTKARNSPAPEPVAQQDPPPSEPQNDPKTREVDEKVERYVQSMNASYDPSYESNDFNSKMRRQSDPNRKSRIQRIEDREPTGDQQDRGAVPSETRASPLAPAPRTAPEEPMPAAQDQAAAPRQESVSTDSSSAGADTNEGIPSEIQKPTPDRPDVAPIKKAQHAPADRPAVPNKLPSPAKPENKPAKSAELAQSESEVADQSATKKASQPPVLGDVKVEAAKKTEAQKPAVLTPEVSERGPVRVLPETESALAGSNERVSTSANQKPQESTEADAVRKGLLDQEAKVAKQPDNVEEQFRLRMMYLADGQDAKALAPAEGMNEEVQEIMLAQIKALMSARSSAKRDPASWANQQMESIESLRQLVAARADLRVPRVVLCTSIESFGRYEPFNPCEFKAGEKNRVLVYIEVENFRSEKTTSDQFRTLLSVRQSLLNKAGEELWSAKDENIEDLSRQRRNDFYLTVGPLSIPKTLAPGEYSLKVEVEDVLGQKLNSGSAKFQMVP